MPGLEESLIYQQCRDAWWRFVTNLWFWQDGNSAGDFHVRMLFDHFGRDIVEQVALYWHEQGRDDIAARVKAIIHERQEETRKP